MDGEYVHSVVQLYSSESSIIAVCDMDMYRHGYVRYLHNFLPMLQESFNTKNEVLLLAKHNTQDIIPWIVVGQCWTGYYYLNHLIQPNYQTR